MIWVEVTAPDGKGGLCAPAQTEEEATRLVAMFRELLMEAAARRKGGAA